MTEINKIHSINEYWFAQQLGQLDSGSGELDEIIQKLTSLLSITQSVQFTEDKRFDIQPKKTKK